MAAELNLDRVPIKFVYLHDLDDICRLCLSNENLFELFETPLLHNFRVATDIPLPLTGKYPKKICKNCMQYLRDLKRITTFIVQCKLAQHILNDQIEKKIMENELHPDQIIEHSVSDLSEIEEIDDDREPTSTKLDPTPSEMSENNSEEELEQDFDTPGNLDDEERNSASPKEDEDSFIINNDHTETTKTEEPYVQVFSSETSFIESLPRLDNNTEGMVHFETEEQNGYASDENNRKSAESFSHCSHCEFSDPDRNNVAKHIALEHEVGLDYKCSICAATFQHSSSLSRHLKIHKMGRLFKCDYCDECFAAKIQLLEHRATHTDEKPFDCQYCDETFSTIALRNLHVKNEHSNDPEVSLNANNVQHSNSFLCFRCGRHFKSYTLYFLHMRRHKVGKRFSCTRCPFRTSLKSALVIHMKDHSREQCVKPEELDRLLNSNKYQCHICSYQTNQRKSFVSHMRVHTGERPFQCSLCSKRFKQKTQLKYHVISHGKIRNFQCQVCNKAFLLKGHLTQHQKRHNGQPPFSCHLCSAGFGSFGKKKKHLLLVHSEGGALNLNTQNIQEEHDKSM